MRNRTADGDLPVRTMHVSMKRCRTMNVKTSPPPLSAAETLDKSVGPSVDQISRNIEIILAFYAKNEQNMSASQRVLETVGDSVGRAFCLGSILLFVELWIRGRSACAAPQFWSGHRHSAAAPGRRGGSSGDRVAPNAGGNCGFLHGNRSGTAAVTITSAGTITYAGSAPM